MYFPAALTAPPAGRTLFHLCYFALKKKREIVSNDISLILLVVYLLALGHPAFLFCYGAVKA